MDMEDDDIRSLPLRQDKVESLMRLIGGALPIVGGTPFEIYAALRALSYGLRKSIGDKFHDTIPRFDEGDRMSEDICYKLDAALALKDEVRS